jgi:POT family proton-dependent oligopeptide transporter
MVIGLITFISQRKRLAAFGKMPTASPLTLVKKRPCYYAALAAGIVAFIGVLHFLFMKPQETDLILGISTVLILGSVIYNLTKEGAEQRRKLWACLILILIAVGFWAIYVQTYTSMMLFADRNMSKAFLGFTMKTEFVQFFNPFFIILLSPLMSRFWLTLSDRGKNPSTPMKFSLGILFMAFGFLLLGGAGRFLSPDGLSSPWWLVLSLFLLTIGELLLSPIGLAMITRLSPHHLVGVMMGVWFLTQSLAFAIGGNLATWSDVPDHTSAVASLQIYSNAFLGYGVLALVLASLGFILTPYINKLIKAPHEPTHNLK